MSISTPRDPDDDRTRAPSQWGSRRKTQAWHSLHPLAESLSAVGSILSLAGLMSGCGGTPTTDPTPEPPPTATPYPTLFWDSLDTGAPSSAFTAVTGQRAGEAWLGTRSGEVFAWLNGSLTLLASLHTPTGDAPELLALTLLSDDQGRRLYAAGTQGALFSYAFDGQGFTWEETGTLSTFHALSAFAQDDVWAVGEGGVYHQDGTGWKRDASFPGSAQLDALWGQSSAHLYVAGAEGALFERTLDTWSRIGLGIGEHLYALWGTSDSDVWLAGQTGLLLHFDGQAWTEADSGSFEHLWALFGFSANQVFAAGTNGTTLYFDGIGWQKLPTGTGANLYELWGAAPSELYSVGAQGTFLRFDNDPTPPPFDTEDERTR